MVIRKTGPRTWTLYTKKKYKGRRRSLGKYRSLKKAKQRERQIAYFKMVNK